MSDSLSLPSLNAYEHLAYVLVGGVFLTVNPIVFSIIETHFASQDWLLILPIAYLAGHFIQALSNVFVCFPWCGLNEGGATTKQDSLRATALSKARHQFNLPELDDGTVWQLCYVQALSRDRSGHISLFNGYYSLYRGLAVVALIQVITQIIILPISGDWKAHVANLAIAMFLGILAIRRANRFYAYIGRRVLQTFLLNSKEIDNAET